MTEVDKAIDLDVLFLSRGDERTAGHASTSAVKIGEKTTGQTSMSMAKLVKQADQ